MKKIKFSKRNILGLILFGLGLSMIYDGIFNNVKWYNADRSSMGIAPKPLAEKEAVVAVFAARTYGWRGNFGVHSWVATKEKNADHYNVYQVAGWYLRRGGSAVQITQDIPDRKWFGKDAVLVDMITGEKAEAAIPKVKKAAADYPYAHKYVVWPGPNSNTFISYIIRNVPELKNELPPTAVGKDFLGNSTFVARTESGTGWQVSLWGVLGILFGIGEGIEINILGLSFGIDIFHPALKLPLIGRVGVAEVN